MAEPVVWLPEVAPGPVVVGDPGVVDAVVGVVMLVVLVVVVVPKISLKIKNQRCSFNLPRLGNKYLSSESSYYHRLHRRKLPVVRPQIEKFRLAINDKY